MKKILVLHRGWVAVGDYVTSSDGSTVTLENASIVRRWGTTKGLGEIALNGPTPNTMLDSCGTLVVPSLGVILALDCKEEKWTSNR